MPSITRTDGSKITGGIFDVSKVGVVERGVVLLAKGLAVEKQLDERCV
jgi:hypothetical protein